MQKNKENLKVQKVGVENYDKGHQDLEEEKMNPYTTNNKSEEEDEFEEEELKNKDYYEPMDLN